MPRPGPRPYECVRRAWHSDRHQPIRGSIIQQIFRVVTEAHSSTTRKNREWQEKLPRVVLKAEEILYSKANSEDEYVNPDTLWERLNDAIDTIIRRDESTETGQCLQPCIEAALVLGCVPVRASRSQRHSTPRSYLSPRFQEPAQAAPVAPDKSNSHVPFLQPPVPSGNQLGMPRSMIGNQTSSLSRSNSQMAPNTSYIATQTVPHSQQCFPRPMRTVPMECSSSLNSSSVYPLYYGSHVPNVQSSFGFQSAQNSNLDNIIVGRPVGWPRAQPTCFSSPRNLLPNESLGIAAEKNEQVRTDDRHVKALEMDCDLSLRLGPSDPSTSSDRYLARVDNETGSSSHQKTSKYTEPVAKNRELCFFPMHNATVPFESCLGRVEPEVLDNNVNNTALRKRKAPDHHQSEHGSSQRLPELQSNQFHGQTRWPAISLPPPYSLTAVNQ